MLVLKLLAATLAATVLGIGSLAGAFYFFGGYVFAWALPSNFLSPEWRLQDVSKRLTKPHDEYQRWVHLGKIAIWTVDAGDLATANAMANELMELAPRYQRDWNYGNVIHDVNIVRGRIALRMGNKAAAVGFLRDAGGTRGSPQLDTYGPNMILARELLEAGEREAVLDYFTQVERFWVMPRGATTAWRQQVALGLVPSFGANIR